MLACRESEKTARALCLSGFLLRVIYIKDSIRRTSNHGPLIFKLENH